MWGSILARMHVDGQRVEFGKEFWGPLGWDSSPLGPWVGVRERRNHTEVTCPPDPVRWWRCLPPTLPSQASPWQGWGVSLP